MVLNQLIGEPSISYRVFALHPFNQKKQYKAAKFNRRNGIGQLLMQKAEEKAKQKDRSLLVLDTREGDPSNNLYTSLGYIQAGRIPNYARSALPSTTIKMLIRTSLVENKF